MTKSRTNADNVTADIAGITAGTGITGGGTSGTVTITNDMATTIAAKGDILAGTANDAYSAITVGTNESRIVADSAQAAGLKYVADTTNYAIAAKGDLLAGTAADTLAALTVGANGTVLTAASGQATGLQWATPASADSVLNLRYPSYYIKQQGTQAVSELVVVEDVTWYIPIFLGAASFDRITIRTSTGFSGSSTVRLGLYNASTTTGKPTTVAFDAGTVVATAPSTNYEITISQTVSAAWYFLAFNDQTLTGTSAFTAINVDSSPLNSILFQTTVINGTDNRPFYSQTGVTGAFATAGTLVAPVSKAPQIALRNA